MNEDSWAASLALNSDMKSLVGTERRSAMAHLKMTREEYFRVHGVFAAAGGNDVKGVSAVLQQSHTRTTVSGTRLDLTLVVQQKLAREAQLC